MCFYRPWLRRCCGVRKRMYRLGNEGYSNSLGVKMALWDAGHLEGTGSLNLTRELAIVESADLTIVDRKSC